MSDITQTQKNALLKLPGFKDIQKQYAKENKQVGAGKKRRMKGSGFWDDVGNWFYQAGQDINQFLKDSKIVSNVAAYALPILGAMGGALLTANPLGATAGGIAGKSTADYIRSQGYGHMGMKGCGYVNQLSQVGTGLVFNRSGLIQNQKTTRMKGGAMKNTAAVPTSTTYNAVYSQYSGKLKM